MRLHRRTEFALHISGHPVVYSTRVGFPLDRAAALYPVIAPVPIEFVGLEPPSRLSSELPLVGGIAEESGIPIGLSARGSLSFADPLNAFARLGVRGASSWGLAVGFILDPEGAATAVTAITKAQDPPFDIVLDRPYALDADAESSGRAYLIDVNGECMVISDVLGDGLILRVTHREVGGTARLTHTCQTGARDNPVVTGWQVVEWRSRLATLYGADVDARGVMGDSYEILRGFLDTTPVSGDNLRFETRLQPLVRVFAGDAEIGVLSTTVVEGLHVHAPGGDEAIDLLEKVSRGGGPAFVAQTRDATVAGSGVLDLSAADVARWSALYDPDAELAFINPMAGALDISGGQQSAFVTGTANEGGGADNQLSVVTAGGGAGPLLDVAAGERLSPLLESAHWRRVELLDAGDDERLLRWPGDPDDADDSGVGRINAQLAAADHIGDDRAWLSVRVVGEVATLTRTVPATVGVAAPNRAGLRLDDIPGVDEAYGTGLGVLSSPLSWSGAVSWLSAGNGDLAAFNILRSPTDRQIRIARSFIRPGDTAILVNDPLDVSSGWVSIRYYDPAGIRRTRAVEVAPGITEVVPALGSPLDGSTIYRIDVIDPSRLPTVSDWTGQGIVVEARPPGFLTSGGFLRWLMTGEGRQGIPAGSIDTGSLDSASAEPLYVGRWRLPELEPGEPASLVETMTGTLTLTRSTMVMRTGPDGVNRITRITVAGENAARVRGELIATDCAEVGPGSFTTDEEIRNAVSLKLDFGPIVDASGETDFDYRLALNVDSRTSQTRFREIRGEDVEVGAAGLIDRSVVPQIESSARSIVALLDAPRRKWTLTTSTAKALTLPLGATIRVTNPRLRGFTPTPVDGELAVLSRRSIGLGSEGAELEFRQTGRRPTGWNAAMRVTGIASPTTVVVAANGYSDEVGPDGTTWQDLRSFAPGASVRLCPRLDNDGGGVVDVVSVDASTRAIEFDGVHSLAIGDFIVPETVAGAAPEVLPYAWLADADGELDGAEGDEYE